MLKYILFFAANICVVGVAKCQKPDTVYYLKDIGATEKLVSTADSADYFMAIFPPNTNGIVPVKEFYKNGKAKFIGQSKPGSSIYAYSYKSSPIVLDGNCITYYPSGKKQSLTHYLAGYPDGGEYLFYPSGRVYCYLKNERSSYANFVTTFFWECYDDNGNMTCTDGSGQWTFYDNLFSKAIMEGLVKNGYMNGEWNGKTSRADSIKYTYVYKNGRKISSTAYDKNGTAYTFNSMVEHANYKGGGPTQFIQSLRTHLKSPRDDNGKKIQIDTMHVSFIIEKDGQFSQFDVIGNVPQNVKDALTLSLKECHEWTPAKYYGIPSRTRIVLPLQFSDQRKFFGANQVLTDPRMQIMDDYRQRDVDYFEKLLDVDY